MKRGTEEKRLWEPRAPRGHGAKMAQLFREEKQGKGRQAQGWGGRGWGQGVPSRMTL